MARTINGVTLDTITVSSTSTPVTIIPAGTRNAGWVITNDSDSATKVWVFQMNADGSLPGSPPAVHWPLAPGATLNDQLVSASSGMDTMLNVGWAAVLKTAGSAEVDVIYR